MSTRTKLTDKQHKKIIARYAECQNYRQVAREFNISYTTVQRHVKGDEATVKKVAQKKQENTKDVFAYLDSKKDKFTEVMELCFEALTDPEKYKKTGVQSIATTMGILIDKYTALAQITQQNGTGNELLQSLADMESRRRDNGY